MPKTEKGSQLEISQLHRVDSYETKIRVFYDHFLPDFEERHRNGSVPLASVEHAVNYAVS
jgi:hypothetical protein